MVLQTDKGINTPVSIEGNNQVRVHYSTGFGKGGSDGREEVAKFLEDNRNNENLDEKIHAVWYFNDCSETKVEESEQELFNMEFGELPVLVVMQNEEKLRDSFREVFVDDEYNAEAKTLAEFGKAMDVIKSQIKLPKVGKYVQARNSKPTRKWSISCMIFTNQQKQPRKPPRTSSPRPQYASIMTP